MSFPFVVRQRAFPGRAIVLTGRSLPYRGVSWGGTQRVDVTWNPGNPVAVSQVIGGTYKPSRIQGMWKDVFLFDPRNAPSLVNFPALQRQALPGSTERGGNTFRSSGSIPGQFAQRARVVRDAFELLRKEGIHVQVEWGSIVRFGFISDTDFPHEREEDINYDIEFTWIGDTDSQPKPNILPKLDVLGLLKQLFALMDALINTLLTALFKAAGFLQKITSAINKIGSFVTALIEILEKLASFAFAPADLIGTLRANLTAIKLAARDLFATLAAGSAAVAAAAIGDPAETSIGNILQQRLRAQAQQLAAFAARQETVLAAQLTAELLGVYTSPGGVTLRDVAQRFYRSANNWRLIAEFNGLSGSIVPVGTVLRIPKV